MGMHIQGMRLVYIFVSNDSDRLLQINIPLNISTTVRKSRQKKVNSLNEGLLKRSLLNT